MSRARRLSPVRTPGRGMDRATSLTSTAVTTLGQEARRWVVGSGKSQIDERCGRMPVAHAKHGQKLPTCETLATKSTCAVIPNPPTSTADPVAPHRDGL